MYNIKCLCKPQFWANRDKRLNIEFPYGFVFQQNQRQAACLRQNLARVWDPARGRNRCPSCQKHPVLPSALVPRPACAQTRWRTKPKDSSWPCRESGSRVGPCQGAEIVVAQPATPVMSDDPYLKNRCLFRTWLNSTVYSYL